MDVCVRENKAYNSRVNWGILPRYRCKHDVHVASIHDGHPGWCRIS